MGRPVAVIAAEHLEAWRGKQVLDPAGEDLGKLEEVYLNARDHEPVLIAVKSGLLGRHSHLIPVNAATVGPDHVRVAHGRETVEQSAGPRDGSLDAEALDSVGAVYGLRFTDGLQLVGSQEVAAQRQAAAEARQRAEKLEGTAREQESRRDEARERAQGAGDEAGQAERDAAEARRAAEEARAQAQLHEDDQPGGKT
jgi:hypothetical protein